MSIAILIPTRGRPEALAALVANIHQATDSDHTIYLIAERTDIDTVKAAMGLDATLLTGWFGSFARAVNHGYRTSTEPLVMLANDDVRFHDGWDTRALKYLNDRVHIVGLNDGSGDCKCFQLVRRAFIVEHSGVYDKPNTLVHDYRHLCCDTELAFYAQFRGVWADAPDVIVEHMHWRFGKADAAHPNYQRALETETEDLDEYRRRAAEWDPVGVTPRAVPGR